MVNNALTTNTTITVEWEKPDIIGRPDFYYNIEISDPESISDFILVNTEGPFRSDEERIVYGIYNVTPATDYVIKVSTHNDVSAHDYVNDFLRFRKVTTRTKEGSEWN